MHFNDAYMQPVSCLHVLCVLSSQNAFLEKEVASLRSELDTSARRAEAQEEELRVICDESVIILKTVCTQDVMMSLYQDLGYHCCSCLWHGL